MFIRGEEGEPPKGGGEDRPTPINRFSNHA
jgi:hypothetical protein